MSTIKTLLAGIFAGKAFINYNDKAAAESVEDLVKERMPERVTFPWTTWVAVDYNPEWENGTGYFDYVVDSKMPEIDGVNPSSVGEVCYITADPSDRLMLIYPTKLGNIAMFQRFSNRNDVWVSNNPTQVEGLMSSNITAEVINMVTCGVLRSMMDRIIIAAEKSINFQHMENVATENDARSLRRLAKDMAEREDYKKFVPLKELYSVKDII